MKKIFMVTLFAVLSCVTLQNTANAEAHGCVYWNCDESGGNDKIGVKNMIEGGEGEAHCYICEKDFCENGDIVYHKTKNIFKQCIQSERSGHDDHWIDYNPQLCDDNDDIKNYSGVEKKYRFGGNPVESYGTDAFGSQIVTNGKEICFYYDCKDGTEPDHKNKKCVDIQKQKAEQEAQKRQKQEQERQKREQQNQIRSKKDKCENSGGSWSNGKCSCDASKNLVLASNKGECECKNSNYVYKSDRKLCEETDISMLKRDCEAAKDSGAYWIASDGTCGCQNESHEFRLGKCRLKRDIENCNAVVGATWNKLKGECVCTNDNMKLNDSGTECVEKESVKKERERQVIIATGGILDGIAAGFDVSVWKDAQGEFNTARLASDSIAGVVLGTVGGVVTSSVMKKHQVEDGFEDLKCSIGGQTVAGWGDEFSVGIQ